jgi:hypothetical protein
MIEERFHEPSTAIPAPKDREGETRAETKESSIKWAALAWLGVIAIFHLGSAAKGNSIYRDQHLGTALEYAKGSINLLKPVIVGFNLNGAPTPLEFPLWQGAAALAFKLFGPWFGWANLVSLLCFFSCLFPLFKLADRFSGPECRWWTLLLFLAQPLVFLNAGLGGGDGLSLAAAVWFLFFASKLWEEQNLKWLGLTTMFGALAALTKLPFFLAAGLGCLFMTAAHHRQRLGAWVWLGMAALVIGSVFAAWNRYSSHCYTLAETPLVDLHSSDPETRFWYFGDLQYRFSPGVWVTGAWRILTALFGSFASVGLLLIALFAREMNKLARWWLAGAIATTLIFFHLVLHHTHYYLMFAPGLALFCAPAAVQLHETLARLLKGRKVAALLLLLTVLTLSTLQGLAGLHFVLYFDKYPRAMAELIDQHTSKLDKLVIQGGGFGGQLLFLADRTGLTVWNSQPLEDQKMYRRLKDLGFTKLVMVSESPLLAAVKKSTSPGLSLNRETYAGHTTPIVDKLPTIFQNQDILIKDLP